MGLRNYCHGCNGRLVTGWLWWAKPCTVCEGTGIPVTKGRQPTPPPPPPAPKCKRCGKEGCDWPHGFAKFMSHIYGN